MVVGKLGLCMNLHGSLNVKVFGNVFIIRRILDLLSKFQQTHKILIFILAQFLITFADICSLCQTNGRKADVLADWLLRVIGKYLNIIKINQILEQGNNYILLRKKYFNL